MKNIMKLKAFMLFLMMVAMMLPIASFAQNDNIIQNWDDENGVRDFALTWTITNNSFGTSPLGSGLLVLTAVGAGYAVARRRRNRKNGTMILLALAMIVGMTGCRKKIVEPIVNPSSNGTTYTINLNTGNGSKVNVTGADVTFTIDDQILVAHNGRYVGALTYTEYETGKYRFQGTITTEVADPKQKLYFYFLGNKIDVGTLTPGTSGSTSCTVNISDQTAYPALPVISFSASNEDFSGNGSYSAALDNKCSLMKFNVTTPSNSPICITGMNNKVTVLFNDRSVNDGFSYSVDSEDGGLIKLKGGSGSPAEKWAIVLPQSELAAGSAGSIYAQNGTYITFNGSRPTIHAINVNGYYHEGDDVITMTVNTATNIIDLGDVTANTTITTGKTVIGTLAGNYKISIAAGAEVTLSGATINGTNDSYYSWAGLNCLGDATIILADGTTNTVKGFYEDYPGIHVPNGSTLTIQGTGSLNASSNGYGAGIGSGFHFKECGHIIINSGTVTATGGNRSAGIGSGGKGSSCGNITINGGTVTATGGQYAAGIGGGGIYDTYSSSCGDITIENTVTSVTATKGSGASNSIGAGVNGTCGTVTIGGVVGAITTSPYTYPVPVPSGAINGKFTINGSGDQVYFSQGNLQATTSDLGANWSWAFAANQWDYIGNNTANNKINGNGTVSENGTVDLFGWVGASSDWTGAALYGISSAGWHGGYGTSTTDALKSDWGNTIGSGWRTLTKDEWYYLFSTRTSGSTVNETLDARYTKATINSDGTGVNGLILFPDGVTIAGVDATSWGTINGNSAWDTKCTSAQWAALAAKGCVFLPAAGYRFGTDVNDYYVGGYGYYWSSTAYESDANYAYNVSFFEYDVDPAEYCDRRDGGNSVRLVKDAN